MGEKNGQVSNLLEDGWFFGNSLLSRSNSSKTMVRCNSDPCSSSSITKEETLGGSQDYSFTMSNLFRTPSLPPCWGRDRKYRLNEDEDEDEDDEPRMGDLIRQAMPMPVPPPMPRRRLERTPSLPPCRVKEGPTVASNGENGDPNAWMKKKGPIAAVSTLTRRASIDSSMLLPPKCTTSKGSKLSTSNSKNRSHRKQDPPSTTNTPEKTGTKLEKGEKIKPQKSLSDLETEELQGFKDLGFSFGNKDIISQSVTNVLPALQRRASIDSSHHVDNIAKVRSRPYLSESWQRSSSPSSAPQVPNKWADPKAALSDDMKAQIKFWARAVASNVRQEC